MYCAMKTFDDTTSGKSRPNDPSNGSQPVNPDYLNESFTSTDEVEMFDNGPDSREERISNRAVKGAAWLLGIVGIFGVAILLAWIIGMNNPPLSSRSGNHPAVAMKSQLVAAPQTSVTPAQFVAILVPANSQTLSLKGATDATKALPANPQPEALASQSTSADNAAVNTQAYNDRIEKEALEVIHGDFGNNPGRQAKLGADYAAVQKRVNQLMHI